MKTPKENKAPEAQKMCLMFWPEIGLQFFMPLMIYMRKREKEEKEKSALGEHKVREG
jgi:hypothetical protein